MGLGTSRSLNVYHDVMYQLCWSSLTTCSGLSPTFRLIFEIIEEIEGNFSLFFCAEKAEYKNFLYLIEKKSAGFRCLVVKKEGI